MKAKSVPAPLCRRAGLTALLLALTICTGLAHKPSDAYLTLRMDGNQLAGEWHLALRDLDYALSLDLNDDGAITWGELRARQSAVSAYALSRLHLSADGGRRSLRITGLMVENHSDGAYAVLPLVADEVGETAALEFNYRAFFDLDPTHRGLLRFERPGGTELRIFSPATPVQRLELGSAFPNHSFGAFIREGVWHIWRGYDHLLFLAALLLPVLLRHATRERMDPPGIVQAFGDTVRIVTAFKAAHSITLALAAFGVARLPPRVVEPAIAASIIAAAVNNLAPVLPRRGWLMAFGFGLIHGFGFANALTDLGLGRGDLAVTLFGFNLGVELGQLAVVTVCFPLSLLFQSRHLYRRVALQAASVAISAVATAWFLERVTNSKWLPF